MINCLSKIYWIYYKNKFAKINPKSTYDLKQQIRILTNENLRLKNENLRLKNENLNLKNSLSNLEIKLDYIENFKSLKNKKIFISYKQMIIATELL